MSTNRMHRSNRLLRTIMAMLLIVAMTVQQGAYVLADETVPQPVTEASAPQTQAATEKHTEPAAPAPQPETTAPETKTPETAAPETKAAETAAPETKAPETAAPETKAAETAAPETAAPETKAPETKAPETAASKSETKAPETASTEKVRENAVSFVVPEGAKVYVDDKDVTNQKGTARDGKIIFKVVPETGYAIASVKVDDTKDARNTHNENEYIIEGIQTDNTVVRVTTRKNESEKTVSETETEIEVDATETEAGERTEYTTESETETEALVENELTAETARQQKNHITTYTFYDNSISVIATITNPDIIPDDAKLVVTRQNADIYIDAANEVADSGKEYKSENMLAYDIHFEAPVTDQNGSLTGTVREIQPDGGSVKILFRFRQGQLSSITDGTGEDVDVIHIDDNGEVEKVAEDVAASTEKANFSVDSFSTFVFSSPSGLKDDYTWNETNGATLKIDDILKKFGSATDFAIFTNNFTSTSHVEGNIAAGTYKTSGDSGNLNEAERIYKCNSLSSITINKVVEGGNDGTFTFGFYNVKGDPICYDNTDNAITISIKTQNGNGKYQITPEKQSDLFKKLENGAIYIKEIDNNGKGISNGEIINIKDKTYNVSYLSSDGLVQTTTNQISGSNTTNYIGQIMPTGSNQGENTITNWNYFGNIPGIISFLDSDYSDIKKDGFDLVITNNSTHQVTRFKNFYNPGAPHNTGISEAEIESTVQSASGITKNISDKLSELATYSAVLAGAKNGPANGDSINYDKDLSKYEQQGIGSADAVNVLNIVAHKDGNNNFSFVNDIDNSGLAKLDNRQENLGIFGLLNKDDKMSQYLVINVDVSAVGKDNTYVLDGRDWNIDGYNSGSDDQFSRLSGHVIYNFVVKDSDGNYRAFDGKLKIENVTAGTIFAPAATVIQKGGAFGSIIANSVERDSSAQEIHKKTITSISRIVNTTVTNKASALEIVKTTIGEVKTPDGTTFTITGPDNYSKTVTYSEFKDGKLTLKDLPVGEYTVIENTDNAKVANYTLNVTGNGGKAQVVKGETATVAIINTYSQVGSLEIEKTTSGDVATPADTTFTIAGPNNYSNTVKYSEFKDGKLTLKDLPVGKYTVTEDAGNAAVTGYTLTVSGDNGKEKQVKSGETTTVSITNTYSKEVGSLEIEKTTSGDVATPTDTTFTIAGPNNYSNTVKYSEFTDEKLTLENLPVGDYTVTENTDSAKVANYTLNVTGNGGTAKIAKGETATVKITNEYSKKTGGLTVSKKVVGGDATKAFDFTVTLDDKTISGTYGEMTFEKGVAMFQLKDGEEKKADGLPFGIVYKVTEAPAAGYIQTMTGAEGAIVPESVLTATFTNTATLVKVSKVDATNSKELAGATIQILDESGKVVAEWVSTTQAHEVVGLEAGKTYRLHETVAPDGYDLAEQDTTFSINKDGTVNAGTTKSVNGVLLVEDQAKKNALAFDKVSMFGMSMVGAKMAVIRLDAGGESVKDTWTTNGKAHQVEGISDGSYVLRELAAPNGFTLAPDVAFTVRDGKASLKQAGNGRLSTAGTVQVVVMTDAAQLGVRDQRFAKVDEQGKFLPGATLQIKTEEGNVIAEWTTDGSEHTERLIGGTYVLTETEAPSGYQVADPISFIVNEKGFIISIGGKAVSGSTDVVVTMTDKKIAAVTKPENEKKQEGKGVKTGDDTPILPMTMTLAISALAVLLILNKRRKETGEQ